jgi:hypothetical protein
MKRIYKYNLAIIDQQAIMMPPSAEIISAQMQAGELKIWAIVDPSAVESLRHFEVFGTGHPIQNNGPRKFLGTVQMGGLVFHVFEYIGV